MAEQNYKNKSFIISFKTQDESSNDSHYNYIAENDEKFKKSVIYSLFNDSNLFQEGNAKDGNWFKVRLVIHSHKDFSIGQVSDEKDVASFAQEFFLEEPGENRKEYLPIIHITLDGSYVGGLFSNKEEHKLPNHISRSFQILDSSIWNKLVPFDRYEDFKMGGAEGLHDAIAEIDAFYQNRLYDLQVAHEYANLNARLAKQAYLSGAHSSGVSPFIFHSETTTKYLIQREFRTKRNTDVSPSLFPFPYNKKGGYETDSLLDKICNRKWRILLLDDKAIEPMDPILLKSEKDQIKGDWNCKKTIILNLLENLLGLHNKVAYRSVNNGTWDKVDAQDTKVHKMPDKDTVILIEYAQSVDDAKDALKQKKYDLVLIDYLLNQHDEAHYGYELLEEIYEDQDNDNHKKNEESLTYKTIRPHHHLRMYCMFISAYSSAVHDRLLAEGLNQSEKYWYINLGACPTNTPQLFLYNLIKIMDKRLDDTNIDDLSIKGIVEILEKIYGAESIRKSAGDYYEKIRSCQYFYRNLLQDYDIYVGDDNIFEASKSVLVTDFLNHHINMGGLLEHIAQLIHLTAFGTVRQWPEMWEEYLYAKAQMEAQIDNNADMEERFERLCNKMEGYILKLKSSAL